MLIAWPSAHVGSDLGDESEGGIRSDTVDLGQIDPGETEERVPDFEAWLVVAELEFTARSRECTFGLALLSSEPLQQGSWALQNCWTLADAMDRKSGRRFKLS